MVAWLHLSDWHQKELKDNEQSAAGSRKEILDRLLDDISSRVENVHSSLEKLDFVVFSGDLAFSGRSREYIDALEFFVKPVLKAAGVPNSRFFIVPGNHDVDRDNIPTGADRDLATAIREKSLEKYREDIDKNLQDPYSRQRVLAPFKAFREFAISGLNNKFGVNDPDFFYFDKLISGEYSVTVVCINSSFLSGYTLDLDGKVDDYGRLSIGEMYLNRIMNLAPSSDVVVVVMHHPIAWLSELEYNRIEELLARKSQFVLHGHQHIPRVHSSHTTDGDIVVIPAGASYQEALPRDPRHVSAYNFVTVDPRERSGTVFLRRWSDRTKSYGADTEIWKGGEFPFVLPELDRKDHSRRRKALHTVEVAAAPYLSRKFSNFTKLSLTHSLRKIENVLVVEQKVEYVRQLAHGAEPDFYVRSYQDKYIVAKSREINGIVPYRHEKLLLGDQEIFPELADDEVIVRRSLSKDPITVEHKYFGHCPVFGVDVTEFGRFTERFQLTINKCPELRYEVRFFGGLKLQDGEFEEIGKDCDRYSLRRLVLPFQGVRVSWQPVSSDLSEQE